MNLNFHLVFKALLLTSKILFNFFQMWMNVMRAITDAENHWRSVLTMLEVILAHLVAKECSVNVVLFITM